MALQAQHVRRLQQIGVVRGAVHIVAAEAGDAARVHQALHEIVALHAVLVRRAVGEMREGGLAELVLFELPEILQLAAPARKPTGQS